MKEMISAMTGEQVSELMYLLSRSGKVVIPQYWTAGSISSVLGQEPTIDQMVEVQREFENDYDLQDSINEKVHSLLLGNDWLD